MVKAAILLRYNINIESYRCRFLKRYEAERRIELRICKQAHRSPREMVERMWFYAGSTRSGGARTVLERLTKGQGDMGE